MKTKKQKIDWKRTGQNNIYMLRLIYKACPGILLVSLLTTIFGALHSFLLNTYLYKYALNAFQEGKELKEILTVIGLMFFFSILCNKRTYFLIIHNYISPYFYSIITLNTIFITRLKVEFILN